MNTILNIQIKFMQSKYGNALYFIPLYQLGVGVYYFLGLSVGGLMAWQFIDQGYLAQAVYEQLVIMASFLCHFLFKKEKRYALVPYMTKLTVSKIRHYILVRELFSGFNFILFPLVGSVLFLSNRIESSTQTYVFLCLCLWLMGLFLNLSARITKFFCIRYKLFFITFLGTALAYSIILVLFYRTAAVFSYSNVLDNRYSMIVLLTGIALLIPGYFYVIKQELYQVYEGNHLVRNTHHVNPRLIPSNLFTRMLLLKYVRCKSFRKFSTPMVSYAIGGGICFTLFDLKLVGLGIFLNIYTFSILPFTIYLSSNYFDGLYTKPVSIKSLLFSSFYIHIVITTMLFLILLFFIAMYDKSTILPLISLYVFISGPMALLLLHNILYAQRFDLFPVQSDFTIQRTFAQKVIAFISAASLFGCAAMMYFFSTIGCYIILSISIMTMMTYSYWIHFLYRKFLQRKYQIMENLRKV